MTRQRLTISSVQMAAILGLENLIHCRPQALVILCPRCLADSGDPGLETENTPSAVEWKIDCQCRERRIINAGIGRAMDADGELAASADQILAPLSLALRCPNPRCIHHSLEVERLPTTTIIRCRCVKTTIRLLTPTVH